MYEAPPPLARPPRPSGSPGGGSIWLIGAALLSLLAVAGAALAGDKGLLVILLNPNPWLGLAYWWRRRGLDGTGWGCLTFVLGAIISGPLLLAALYGVYFIGFMMHPPS